MKAISVKPEWADKIESGVKTLEIRSRRTYHRGPLLFCSTKPEGVTRCIASVVRCRRFERADEAAACSPWRPGLWAWVLTDIRPVTRVPVIGQRGMFEFALEP